MFGCAGSLLLRRPSSCGRWGLHSRRGAELLTAGAALMRAWALGTRAPAVGAPGLQNTGSVAPAHGLSCSGHVGSSRPRDRALSFSLSISPPNVFPFSLPLLPPFPCSCLQLPPEGPQRTPQSSTLPSSTVKAISLLWPAGVRETHLETSWEEEASGPSSLQPPSAGTQRAGFSKPS